MKYNVKKSKTYGSMYDPRYIIVDADTGELLDDAQGYGYKSPQKAHAAFAYKNRDRRKDKGKLQKRREILTWMKEHKDFVEAMDQYTFEIAKGSWGPDDKFDAKFVAEMLLENGYTDLPFTAGELLRVWKKL